MVHGASERARRSIFRGCAGVPRASLTTSTAFQEFAEWSAPSSASRSAIAFRCDSEHRPAARLSSSSKMMNDGMRFLR
eukprot:8881636-Pyramimonas_sp.AAC.1